MRILDGTHFFRILVGNFNFKRVFERHDELDLIKRVRPEVVDE